MTLSPETIAATKLAVYAAIATGLLAFLRESVRVWATKLFNRLVTNLRHLVTMPLTCPVPAVTRKLDELTAVVTDMTGKVDGLVAQHKNNGGSSSKDQWDRIDAKLTGLVVDMQYLRVAQDIHAEHNQTAQFQSNENGETIWCNRALKQLAGMVDDGEWAGMAWLNAVHPEDQAEVRENWARAVREKREYRDQYRIVIPPVDRVVHIFVLAKPVSVGGKVSGWSGLVRTVGYGMPDRRQIKETSE